MPSSKVKRAKDKRNIQVHTGELHLADYKWTLKSWEGEFLATQHFRVSSEGGASRAQGKCMGKYTLVRTIVMYQGIPVYKHDEEDIYLYRNETGDWCVGKTAGDNMYALMQPSKTSLLSPSKTLPWEYFDGKWSNDITLIVYPCY